MSGAITFIEADITYVTANFRRLPALCSIWNVSNGKIREEIEGGTLPRATYVLPEGREFFPDDYFVFGLEIEPSRRRDTFIRRFVRACDHNSVTSIAEKAEEAWDDYLTGVYGVCLNIVLPETIVAKAALIERIERFIESPQPAANEWRASLRCAVDALDGLLRPFTACDRVMAGRPTSRDRFIVEVRREYA